MLVIGWATVAAGQSVVNPTVVQFTPSADNAAVTSDGKPVVVRYEVWFYDLAKSVTTPVRMVDMGKPTVGSDGTIQVVFAELTPWPLPNGIYQARVVAIGQTSQGQSDWSNPFTFATGTGGSPPPMKPTGIGAKVANALASP